ncbi:MAG: hypothetical protein M1826_003683 [Phylliscum demangeonii]|nr:MAG: hypothetical protein M1826_003683 [Phylliscum demangeonii]
MASDPVPYQYFLVTTPREHVALVEINRPEKLNAFIEPMWLELRTLFNQLSLDPNVRAIVLTGAGSKAFTAGLDLAAALGNGLLGGALPSSSSPSPPSPPSPVPRDPARTAVVLRRHLLDFQDCVSSIERCEKRAPPPPNLAPSTPLPNRPGPPTAVICVLHGHSYGLALDISSCADIRLCSADTRFAVKEIDAGLAADLGSLSRLPALVSSATWVRDVCLTGRAFGPAEALRVGFVSGVWPDKTSAVRHAVDVLAAEIAAKSPVAVLGTKELLNWSRGRVVADALRYTAVWNSAALQTEDVPRAARALMSSSAAAAAADGRQQQQPKKEDGSPTTTTTTATKTSRRQRPLRFEKL